MGLLKFINFTTVNGFVATIGCCVLALFNSVAVCNVMEWSSQQIAFGTGLAQDLGLHSWTWTRQETFWVFKEKKKQGGTTNLHESIPFFDISTSSDNVSSIKISIFGLAGSFSNNMFLILSFWEEFIWTVLLERSQHMPIANSLLL